MGYVGRRNETEPGRGVQDMSRAFGHRRFLKPEQFLQYTRGFVEPRAGSRISPEHPCGLRLLCVRASCPESTREQSESAALHDVR